MKTNLSRMTLMGNMPIRVEKDDKIFIFYMPTLEKEYNALYDLNIFLGFCAENTEELIKRFKAEDPTVQLTNKYECVKATLFMPQEISAPILYWLASCIQDFEYVDDSFRCGAFDIDDEVFDFFCNCISIACGVLSFEDYEKNAERLRREKEMSQEELEWERRCRENEAKVRKNKQKNNKGTRIEKVVPAVMREFHMTIQDIYNLNKYTLYYLYSLAFAIDAHTIKQISFGNGLVDGKKNKYKYWAEN